MCVTACSTVHSLFFFFEKIYSCTFLLFWPSCLRRVGCQFPDQGQRLGPLQSPNQWAPEASSHFLYSAAATSQPWHCWYLASTHPGPSGYTCSVILKSVIRQGQVSPGSTSRTPVGTTAVQGWYLANGAFSAQHLS